MAETMKPNIIIDDIDTLTTCILNLSFENNKQAFFKVDIKKIKDYNIILT